MIKMGKFLILKMFVLGLYGEISPDLKFNLQGIGGKTYNESIFAQKNSVQLFSHPSSQTCTCVVPPQVHQREQK